MAPRMVREDGAELGLAGAVVLVTGSTRGIGRATAARLASVGAHVVATGRQEAEARSVANQITKESGVEAMGVACDVSNPDAVAALFGHIDAWGKGPLRGVVNNAGYPFRLDWWDRTLDEFSPEEAVAAFRAVAAVDLDGARLCTYHALRRFRASEGGSLVYVSSTPALTGYKGTPYTEAKAAVLGLMRDVARSHGRHGVRSNAVALGNIATQHMAAYTEADREALGAEASLGRWGTTDEAADAILFLVSDLARFITGQTLIVDGGTVMR